MRKAIIVSTILSVGAASAAQAGAYSFKDVSGHGRSNATLRADSRACGASPGFVLPKDSRAFKTCMSKYGWRVAAMAPRSHAHPAQDSFFGFILGGTSSDDTSSNDADAQATEQANDDALRRDEAQRQQDQQTQDMINTQNMINSENAVAAQQAADAAAAAAATASQ